MEKNPYSSPEQSSPFGTNVAAAPGVLPMDVIMPLYNAKGWMKLIGIVNIVFGVLYCITIVGAVVGWLPLWIGVLLTKASGHLETGVASSSSHEIGQATSKLGTLFTIFGVLTLIQLIIICLYFVAIIVMVIGAIVAGTAATQM